MKHNKDNLTINTDNNLSLFHTELTNLLGIEFVKAKLFANGDINFSPDWKDNAVQALISSGVIISIGIITILITAGVIVLLPGITIPISLAGLALGIGYTKYHTAKKQKEYGRINTLFYQRKSEDDLVIIVENITSMYQQTINKLVAKDIPLFAQQFSKIIIRLMKKDKINEIDDLLQPCSLYKLITSQKTHIHKDNIAIQPADGRRRNTYSAMFKMGLYSEEHPDTVYIQTTSKPKSRPDKYGLLFFQRSANFEAVLNSADNYGILGQEESEQLIRESGLTNIHDIEEPESSSYCSL